MSRHLLPPHIFPRSLFNILTIVVALLSHPLVSGLKTFDICANDINPTTEDYHEGVILSISTGNKEALNLDQRYPKCNVDLTFVVDHGERTELSYYKPPVSAVESDDTTKCIDYDATTEAQQNKGSIPCNSINPRPKIHQTWTKLKNLALDVFQPIVEHNPLLNFQIFIQNVAPIPQTEYIYTTNRLSFECTHPNPYLIPNLNKDGVGIGEPKLKTRTFDMSFPGPEVPVDDAGKYDCSWGDPASNALTPTKSVNAILYSPEIICEVRKKDAETNQMQPLANKTGSHVDVTIFKGEMLTDYEMGCSLMFAGPEEQGKEALLKWDDPVWDPVDSRNGNPLLSGSNQVEGNYRRRSFTHEAQLNSSVSYTCKIHDDLNSHFVGRVGPTECKIIFATEEYIEATLSSAAGPWWIAIIVLVVVFVFTIVIVIFMRSRKLCAFADMTRSDGVPALAHTADEKGVETIDGMDNISIDTREQDLENNENKSEGGGGGEGEGRAIENGVPAPVTVVRVEVEKPFQKPNGVASKTNGFVIPKEADDMVQVEDPIDNAPNTGPSEPPPPLPEIVYANAGSESKTADTDQIIGEVGENPYAVILVEETV